ncbi:hypothetical protein AAFF_G00130280 [Aldrovandia affinis]|uniref:Uncharacterized protein n=1 Tax=Aldrovandia affinis TaxID=143900 RepID=A0AAD7RRA1_9TELE|nr:hypothetical protein AAFF_G00130280 [Aldrovandia affinis]
MGCTIMGHLLEYEGSTRPHAHLSAHTKAPLSGFKERRLQVCRGLTGRDAHRQASVSDALIPSARADSPRMHT